MQKDNKFLSAKRKAKVDKAAHPENAIISWSVNEDSVKANSKKSKKKK